MGSVMRACGCFKADEIYYTGERFNHAQRYNTDTKNARLTHPQIHTESIIESAPEEVKIVCVELVENAIALPEFQHPDRALYIFGPEDYNLSQKVINQADHVVFIPTAGCLNLAATVHVVLYDRQSKRSNTTTKAQSNELVRNSRDCRNHLVAASSNVAKPGK